MIVFVWMTSPFSTATQVPVLVKFVFHVALPCLVVNGIGIGVDFYSDDFVWEYVHHEHICSEAIHAA